MRRPVLVWIHGGGFISGSGSLPIYHGDTFARDGHAVVISINYRIGALGFLHTGPGRESNLWLTDQIQALKWIHENIRTFGGDPDNITVAGQSGGAFSAAALAVNDRTRPLIKRIILQSAPLGLHLATRRKPKPRQPHSCRRPRSTQSDKHGTCRRTVSLRRASPC